MSWQGAWAGNWQGSYEGAQAPSDPNALSGTTLLTVSAVGLLLAIGHIQGVATLSVSAAGSLEAVVPTGDLSGVADLSVHATAALIAVGHLSGVASLTLTAYEYVEPPVVEPVPQVQQSGASGLGSPSDGGRGYVYKDHQWVRLLPVRITRTRTNDPVVTVGSTQRLPVAQSQSTTHPLTAASSASVTLKPSFATQNTNAPYVANSVHTALTTARLTATTHATKDDYIEFDEILTVLDFA